MINYQRRRLREEQETFEYPKMDGKGPKIRQIGNLYAKLIDLEDNLPKGINEADYLEAKKALKKMWLSVNGRTTSDTKNNVYRTEDGDFPPEGSFISCTHRYLWKPEYDIYSPEREGISAMIGLYSTPRTDWLSADEYPIKKSGVYEYTALNFVESGEVHPFKYFSDLDFLLEGEPYPVENILKWREDTEKEFNKVPKKVIDEISSKRH